MSKVANVQISKYANVQMKYTSSRRLKAAGEEEPNRATLTLATQTKRDTVIVEH
jgi:hypothetical protein